jgi:hypothetical protein
MRLRKIAKSYYLLRRVRPSARMEQLGSHWTDIYEIWYLIIFFERNFRVNSVVIKIG